MHFNFDFTAVQVLWTLTFAALLVLLVVLLGRDRARRYPWFTTIVALMALRLLTSRLLFGKLPQFTFNSILIVLADVMGLVGLLVLVELARRAFDGLQRPLWIANSVGLLAVAGTVLGVWGPWPAWKTLTADSHTATLRVMQMVAQKAELLVILLTVGLCLLVVLFGRRYKAGWRSHTQQILLGLSTASIAQLGLQVIVERIVRTATPHSQAELDKILGFRDKLINADNVVYLVVVLWWIVCLWIDEPGTNTEAPEVPVEEEP